MVASGRKKTQRFCGVVESLPINDITQPTPQLPLNPTNAPSLPKTPACMLKAKLGYNLSDPDESKYTGFNTDMLEARIKGKARSNCGWHYDNSEWCTYENSDPNGDSSFIVNLDDNSFVDKYDIMWEDMLTVHNASGQTIIFGVEVCFFSMQLQDRRANQPMIFS